MIKIEKWSIFRLYVTLKVNGFKHDKKVSFWFFKFCLQGFFGPTKSCHRDMIKVSIDSS
jgi:hypothetical protein